MYPDDCPDLPDGTNPKKAIDKWLPWITEIRLFMDGDGTMRHFKYSGSYAEQPFIDIQIYSIARATLIQCENDKRDSEYIKGN